MQKKGRRAGLQANVAGYLSYASDQLLGLRPNATMFWEGEQLQVKGYWLNALGKAAVNRTQSKRFARFQIGWTWQLATIYSIVSITRTRTIFYSSTI